MPILCPLCGTSAPDDAVFCEQDGTRLRESPPGAATLLAAPVLLAAPLPSCRCGAGAASNVDGYCDACGRKWVQPRKALPRDHIERALSLGFAGVTDRGQRHSKNEDDFAISLTDAGDAVLVVCDGVSSSEEADRASAIASKTMTERLGEPTTDAANAFRIAVAAANRAVSALHSSAPGATSAPPETTVVAAVVRNRDATIGWVGDSRAYWIDAADPEAARLLTHDHSWLNDVVDSGEMTREEAGNNRLAHAITRCLGASDDPESGEPTVTAFVFPDTAGYLLLCSDGLWNYSETPQKIAELVRDAPQNEGAVGIARSLVDWANAQGGRDNITVTLLAVSA
ncbi:MAG: protein phosphatase 2C domain-containing protein, partial [Armatimonadetes bacterium]|nr:protein phosphatase 2C domain-containing protein [Armatimonadota bacterium]